MKKIIIAIMAHNEEKVILRAICSCLSQKVPDGFELSVLVVANGCNDQTERIVADMKNIDTRINLISLDKKGKTIALNEAIVAVLYSIRNGCNIPYVVFFDADCEFVGSNALIDFINIFIEEPLLCAVGASCVPRLDESKKSWAVLNLYSSLNKLIIGLPVNTLKGMAYCVRSEILREKLFPEIQMADDIYISALLDGWFFRCTNVYVHFSIPRNMRSEFKKRIRQEVANIHSFNYLKSCKYNDDKSCFLKKGILNDQYRWRGFSAKNMLRVCLQSLNIKDIVFVFLSLAMRKIALLLAKVRVLALNEKPSRDYWSVER